MVEKIEINLLCLIIYRYNLQMNNNNFNNNFNYNNINNNNIINQIQNIYNNINQINNNINYNNNNINNNNNNNAINNVINQINNHMDQNRIRQYLKTMIDYILYLTRSPNAVYSNDYVVQMNNHMDHAFNMFFNNDAMVLINDIMMIVQQSSRDQMKDIYNLL